VSIKKLTKLSVLSLATLVLCFASLNQAFAATFNQNSVASDLSFNNVDSMNAAQIDAWINSNFGSVSCISTKHGFSAPDPTGYNPTNGYLYGSSVSAGHVIYDAAQAYGINPQVLLTTLQKEQSLVTGTAGCVIQQYAAATGYGCPDSGGTYSYSGVDLYSTGTVFDSNYNVVQPGNIVTAVSPTCVNSAAKVGFSQQVIRAAWLLKFGQQRSEGNIGWAVVKGNWDNSDDPQSCYGGPMTQGTWQRCASGSSTYYDGYTTIDGTAVHMDNGATAALYWYTPHFSGNQSFLAIFSSWFGDPNSPCNATSNDGSATSGNKIVTYGNNLAFMRLNNTGSACAELHIFSQNFQSWNAHIATGMRSSNPANGMLVPTSFDGKNQSGLTYMIYSGAGGAAEVHRLSPDLTRYPGYYDVATNLSGVNATSGTFVAGDFLGMGHDQMAYVLYDGSSGKVEVHLFDPSLQRAVGYYDVATNLSGAGINPSNGTFVAADFVGLGHDQLAYVAFNGTSTGKVEIHVFNPSLQKAVGYYDVATTLNAFDPNQ
jgi:hypothetical protein